MQAVGSCIVAEDSCFIKTHSKDAGGGDTPGTTSVASCDIEKAAVNSQVSPIADGGPHQDGAPQTSSSYEKNISGDTPGPNSRKGAMNSLDCKEDFPEGGLKAWSVVVGAFCGSFSIFALINSTGVLLEYLQAHQLKDYTSSQISWIFGLQLFLIFFCGAPAGPIFDAYGPRVLIFVGSILLVVSMFLLGLCTRKLTHNSFLVHTTKYFRILAVFHGVQYLERHWWQPSLYSVHGGSKPLLPGQTRKCHRSCHDFRIPWRHHLPSDASEALSYAWIRMVN
jgi:hypothetical protein